MNCHYLPVEILEKIFLELEGQEVAKCREVCRRWRDVVDSLLDVHWRKICDNDIMAGEYLTIKERTGLPWRDLYRVVNSWNNVPTAGMHMYEVENCVQRFKVISDRIVAILMNDKNQYCHWYSNVIVYYDLETRRETDRERFDFCFSSRQYDENEHFYVLTQSDGSMIIILKADRSHHIVGNLNKYGVVIETLEDVNFSGFSIIGKEVYFHDGRDEVIYLSTLVEIDGRLVVNTIPLNDFKDNSLSENVIGFSKKDGILRILTDAGKLYMRVNGAMQLVQRIDPYMCHLFEELRGHGFDWHEREVYNWLCPQSCPVVKVFFAQGNVVLGSKPHSAALYIYITWCFNGLGDLYRIVRYKSKRKIGLQKMIDKNDPFQSIQQLNLVESLTEHKVLILIQNRLLVIELSHGRVGMTLRSKFKQALEEVEVGPVAAPVAKRARKAKPKKTAQAKWKTAPKAIVKVKSKQYAYATRRSARKK